MESNSLERALSRGITALETISEKEIRKLSLRNCAFMLTALPATKSLSGVRTLLAERLRDWLSTARVEHDDAYEVYSVLTALWIYNPTYVAGEWLAAAIHRLVQSEAAEGGPYYTGNTIAVAANIQIAIFVRVVAKPLPNMKRFFKAVVAARRFDETDLTDSGLLYLLAAACDCEELARYVEANWQHP